MRNERKTYFFLIFIDFRGPRDGGNNIVPPSPNSKGKGDSPMQSPDDPISDESGVGHEEEEAELLLELLSNIRTPKVSPVYFDSVLLMHLCNWCILGNDI